MSKKVIPHQLLGDLSRQPHAAACQFDTGPVVDAEENNHPAGQEIAGAGGRGVPFAEDDIPGVELEEIFLTFALLGQDEIDIGCMDRSSILFAVKAVPLAIFLFYLDFSAGK